MHRQGHTCVVRQRRDQLRELLRAGTRRGVLPWGQTRMADFSIVGELVENVIFLDLDEELA